MLLYPSKVVILTTYRVALASPPKFNVLEYACYVRVEKLNRSTSLENDNMCYVSFRI